MQLQGITRAASFFVWYRFGHDQERAQQIHRTEGQGRRIITYCAGCANFQGKIGPTVHLLDLVFDPATSLSGKAKVTKSPITYLKRLLLKHRFRKKQKYASTRERVFIYSDYP